MAVTDDIFLKAYFAKVIQAPELQTEVKKLLKGGASSYATILELIHEDYRAQETGEQLRDSITHTPQSVLRRSKTEGDDTATSSKAVKVKKTPSLTTMVISYHHDTILNLRAGMKRW